MDVKFITTVQDLIDTVPIVDGNVVTTKDANHMFYDMYQTRYHVGAPMWEPIYEGIGYDYFISDGTLAIIYFETNCDVVIQFEGSKYPNTLIGKVNEDVPIIEMPKVEREGYRFLGWFSNRELTGPQVETLPAKYTQGKTIYYASWYEIPKKDENTKSDDVIVF